MNRIFVETAEESAGTLTLPLSIRDAIRRHGESGYPEEVVGIMIGVISGNDRTVEVLREMDNTMDENRRRRYTIDPLALAKVERDADKTGKVVLGFYHTHPDHPAEPSQTDLDWAWPFYSYVIQSVQNGKADIIRSWRLRENDGGDVQTGKIFVEEELQTT